MRLLNELADNPILKKVRGSSERDDEQVQQSLAKPLVACHLLVAPQESHCSTLHCAKDRGPRSGECVLLSRTPLADSVR